MGRYPSLLFHAFFVILLRPPHLEKAAKDEMHESEIIKPANSAVERPYKGFSPNMYIVYQHPTATQNCTSIFSFLATLLICDF